VAAAVEVLRSGWITTGPRTKEFEAEFARVTGARHAVAVNSCTAALHLALEAVGLRATDEVIVPSVTFAATAEVVRYFGAMPVIVDVRESDHNIDVAAIRNAMSEKTRAIIPVHFGGVPCDMDEIVALSKDRGVRVIDDAAHAFPCLYKERPVGTLADITCFSFYATKTITTAEGGAAVTANEAWAERMRVMSLHGISKDAWKRYTAEGSWHYDIMAPGFKYNLTDLAAAIGLVQLRRASDMLGRRSSIAAAYREAFQRHGALDLMEVPIDRGSAHHLFVLKLKLDRLKIDRDAFIVELKRRGVSASVHFIPLHLHSYYRDALGYRSGQFPVAEGVYRRSVSLPIYSKMSDGDVNRVIEAVLGVTSTFGI
jgi:perosamine synthetase